MDALQELELQWELELEVMEEASKPQALQEAQLARLGYRQAQLAVHSPLQDEELEHPVHSMEVCQCRV